MPNAAADATIADTWSTSLAELLSNPPSWITWLSLITAVLALGWRVVDDIRRRIDRRHDARRDTNEFWYRQVVIPHFLKPLIDGISSKARELEQMQGELGRMTVTERRLGYDTFLREFKKLAGALTYDFMLIAVLDPPTYDQARTTIEKIEDGVALHCQERGAEDFDVASAKQSRHANVPTLMRAQLNETVKLLIDFHHELNSRVT